jgi:hypothetical protein
MRKAEKVAKKNHKEDAAMEEAVEELDATVEEVVGEAAAMEEAVEEEAEPCVWQAAEAKEMTTSKKASARRQPMRKAKKNHKEDAAIEKAVEEVVVEKAASVKEAVEEEAVLSVGQAKAKPRQVPWKDRAMKVQCQKCGIRFQASYHLVRHTQAVHDKVKNYRCDKPGCGQRFGWLANLQAHRIQGHGERGAHACTSCTLSYATPSLLALHVSRIHLEEKLCVCEVPGCGAAFVWIADLQAHRRRLHGLAKLRCAVPGCRRTNGFLSKTTLHKHLNTYHQA